MKVTIKDKEIELKLKFRSYIIYEAITKTMFSPQTITDIIIYFYSVLISCDPDLNLTLDEFMDWLDNNNNVFSQFTEWLSDTESFRSQFNKSEDESDSKKKIQK